MLKLQGAFGKSLRVKLRGLGSERSLRHAYAVKIIKSARCIRQYAYKELRAVRAYVYLLLTLQYALITLIEHDTYCTALLRHGDDIVKGSLSLRRYLHLEGIAVYDRLEAVYAGLYAALCRYDEPSAYISVCVVAYLRTERKLVTALSCIAVAVAKL